MSEQFDGKRAYEHIHALSIDIGARVSGTSGEGRAADYVRRQFKAMGLNPQVLSFDAEDEAAENCSLRIVGPEIGQVPALPLVGSPDTPLEGLSGELVFVEQPSEPYAGPHLEGKIVVMVNGGWLGRNQHKILRYKPAALILVGRTLGIDPNTFHVILKQGNKPYGLVPTLHITYTDALRLWNARARLAHINLQTRRQKGASHSVIAEVKGSDFPDEIIAIGGHMDTVPVDPGATDNAAGVATVLELARLFAQRGSRRTLRFAAWGSEEGSGAGSMKYILELKKKDKEQRASAGYIEGYSKTELEQHQLYINLDVLGMGLGHNIFYYQAPEAVGNYMKALTCELGVHHEISTNLYGSDNLVFAWAGVPAVGFSREGVGTHYMHTALDNLDLIDEKQLATIGNLIDVFITRSAARGHVWAFERQVPVSVAEEMKGMQAHVREVIEFLGEDPGLAK